MFLLAAIEGRCPFVDFPQVGQEKSGDIFLLKSGDDIEFKFILKLQGTITVTQKTPENVPIKG